MNKYHVDNINTHSLMVDEFLKQYSPTKDFTVLEIGCNEARNLYAIQKDYPNCKIFGTDININAIMQARESVPKGVFYVHDIEGPDPLPIDEQSMDFILFIDVLEHLKYPDDTLIKIKKYLKPNGKVLCSIPNIMNWTIMKGIIQYGDFSYQDTGILDKTHLRFFTFNESIRMFNRCGYKIENNLKINLAPIQEEDIEFVNKLASLGKITEYLNFINFKEFYEMFEMGFALTL